MEMNRWFFFLSFKILLFTKMVISVCYGFFVLLISMGVSKMYNILIFYLFDIGVLRLISCTIFECCSCIFLAGLFLLVLLFLYKSVFFRVYYDPLTLVLIEISKLVIVFFFRCFFLGVVLKVFNIFLA